MGGSSNGPTSRARKSPPSGEGLQNRSDPCDISFITPLAHVRTTHSTGVAIGEILKVEIEIVTQKKTIACKRQNGGAIVGFVLARGAQKLIECIEQDNIYVAEVRKADFGHLEVSVRRSL